VSGARTSVALLAACGALSGCRQILGTGGYGVREDAGVVLYQGVSDGVSYTAKSCRDCVDQSCAREAAACAGEPACLAMATCLAKCSPDDHACRGQCNLTIPGTPEMTALIACEASACSEAGCGASRALWGGESCDACLAERPGCSEALLEFSKNPGELHPEPCSTSDCRASVPTCGCDAYSSTEAPTVSALLECTTGICQSACSGSSDWTCLGSVQAPVPAPGKRLDLHLSLVQADNFTTPVSSFSVAACTELDPDCVPDRIAADASVIAVAPTTTGTAELTTMDAPPQALGQRFFGHLLVTSSYLGYPGALLYFFPPVRQSPAWITRRLVSRNLADATARNIGVTLDWTSKGGVVFSSTSCDGIAPGVHVELTGGEHVYYFGDAVGVEPDAGATSSSGLGFVPNLVPGARTVTATLKASGQLVGKYQIQVVAGMITHLILNPEP